MRADALMTILPAALARLISGDAQPLPRDEGAHIFQLSIVFVSTLVLFFATADWREPRRNARPLMFPAAALVVAFSVLYYFEHYL